MAPAELVSLVESDGRHAILLAKIRLDKTTVTHLVRRYIKVLTLPPER
jgi:hypothetical protein